MTPPAKTLATHPWTTETVHSVIRASAIVLLGALLIGGLSSLGQQYLPDWIRSLCNSAGGWSAFVFLLVWLSRGRPLLGALLGLVAFEVMLEGYGVVSGLRGHFYAAPFSTLYAKAALLAGPVLGAGASLTRYGNRVLRLAGVAVLSLVLLGEGAYGLLWLLDSTSPVFWTMEMIAGASFFAAVLVRNAPRAHTPPLRGLGSRRRPGPRRA
ncbi:MAG: hypothetical protein JWP75_2258 [Frondihabitans sp.]|nr:hypothetical protein [Frondihabitans sp.]